MKRLLVCVSRLEDQLAVARSATSAGMAVVMVPTIAEAVRQAEEAAASSSPSTSIVAAVVAYSDLAGAEDQGTGDLGAGHLGDRLVLALGRRPLFLVAAEADLSEALAFADAPAVELLPLPLDSALLAARLAALAREPAAVEPADGPADQPGSPISRPIPRRKSDVLLGGSPVMEAVRQRIFSIARTDLPVAVYGESGTGKELSARMIHCDSRRRHGSLVVANCAALPETLFENELFGHERGSYTGAVGASGGLIEEARGGTLVLDEIGELPLSLQAKLLRVIQFGTYRRVGGSRVIDADVRIVAVTNRDLRRAVAEGTFRQDLYYRINVLHVRMPPLREHPEDMPLLVHHASREFCGKYGRETVTFTDDAIAALVAYDWPGNVRELESVIQSTLALHPEPVLTARHIELTERGTPAPPPGGPDGAVLDVDLALPFGAAKQRVVDRFEARYLGRLLQSEGGNLAAAARRAGTDRKTLWRLLRKHGLEVTEFRR